MVEIRNGDGDIVLAIVLDFTPSDGNSSAILWHIPPQYHVPQLLLAPQAPRNLRRAQQFIDIPPFKVYEKSNKNRGMFEHGNEWGRLRMVVRYE